MWPWVVQRRVLRWVALQRKRGQQSKQEDDGSDRDRCMRCRERERERGARSGRQAGSRAVQGATAKAPSSVRCKRGRSLQQKSKAKQSNSKKQRQKSECAKPQTGVEPVTFRLQSECSTTKLQRQQRELTHEIDTLERRERSCSLLSSVTFCLAALSLLLACSSLAVRCMQHSPLRFYCDALALHCCCRCTTRGDRRCSGSQPAGNLLLLPFSLSL